MYQSSKSCMQDIIGFKNKGPTMVFSKMLFKPSEGLERKFNLSKDNLTQQVHTGENWAM